MIKIQNSVKVSSTLAMQTPHKRNSSSNRQTQPSVVETSSQEALKLTKKDSLNPSSNRCSASQRTTQEELKQSKSISLSRKRTRVDLVSPAKVILRTTSLSTLT